MINQSFRLSCQSPLFSTVVLLALSSATSLPQAALGEDWTQFRGVDRANRSAETGLFGSWIESGTPPLAWLAEGLGSGYPSISVASGVIYTSGNFDDSQSVVAISAEKGAEIWKQAITNGPPKHGYDGSRTTPTVDGDRLYAVSSDGKIACLDRAAGSIVWERDFKEWNGKMMSGWGYSESPLVDGDNVICTPGGSEGMLVALNKSTGDQVWACELPQRQGSKGRCGIRFRRDLSWWWREAIYSACWPWTARSSSVRRRTLVAI